MSYSLERYKIESSTKLSYHNRIVIAEFSPFPRGLIRKATNSQYSFSTYQITLELSYFYIVITFLRLGGLVSPYTVGTHLCLTDLKKLQN